MAKGKNPFVVTALINAASSTVNSYLSRKQQRELAEQNQKFSAQMEANRQRFQLQINQENARIQNEMSEKNHQIRLLEQQNNFELMCKSSEWQHFLNDWPLRIQPSVLRQEQIHADGSVALRVFFAKSSNKFFAGYIYPRIEQGLLEFVDCYHNVFNSHNIIFYHNAYKDNIYGGAINSNIRYALKELPVIIIDSNVLNDEICISATVWGFGNALEQHATVFKLPYKIETQDGQVDMNYVNQLTNQLLAYLKFVLGYAYDTYNLIMYNTAPLLPSVAHYELKDPSMSNSSPFQYKGILKAIGEQYREIYASVLAIGNSEKDVSFAEKPESFKKTILHELRLEYANAIKEFVSIEEFLQILDESIKAWCDLRSPNNTEEFLKSLRDDPVQLSSYFSVSDIDYFVNLCNSYKKVENISSLGRLCLELEDSVLHVKDKLPEHPKKNKEIEKIYDDDNKQNQWIEL